MYRAAAAALQRRPSASLRRPPSCLRPLSLATGDETYAQRQLRLLKGAPPKPKPAAQAVRRNRDFDRELCPYNLLSLSPLNAWIGGAAEQGAGLGGGESQYRDNLSWIYHI